jgi:phage gp36-like protein
MSGFHDFRANYSSGREAHDRPKVTGVCVAHCCDIAIMRWHRRDSGWHDSRVEKLSAYTMKNQVEYQVIP